MTTYDFLNKYPRTKQLMQETGMTLDQILIWTENELKKQEQSVNGKSGNSSICR